MGMFYVFYLASNNRNSFTQIKKTVIDITPTVSQDISKGSPQIVEDTDDQLRIWCDFFSLVVKNGGQSVRFRSEDYGMNFRYQFWFDVYTVNPNWLEGMLCFIGNIMKMYDGDCVLESNGDTPIAMRKDNSIIIDDKNLNGMQSFPFFKLGIECQQGDLKQV